ncbi:hypothetical protein JX266_009801 [Neoarthrinium moseri]|uniref:uncharacterized protein n=1 Tax=Neoarthrinium moseri TaxID=1658444 RepID=UPI001FDCD653|nr:uncharacterized protein JN550_013511 [Neoarthrinium moseri]KAI1844128.1 hypothetical protein JX266_009801 [Neoarthrinium moseri]KAI1856980.1 hypothetical protein JN550_013511 [Neoarthrinium moseri]
MNTMASAMKRFKLVFFVPPSSLSQCKDAIFAAGADTPWVLYASSDGRGRRLMQDYYTGRYPGPGNYTECCWTSLGTGQFRPGDTAKPHLGKVGEVEQVEEVRVETLCMGEDVVKKAVEALKSAHPYEEPAYEVYKLEDY